MKHMSVEMRIKERLIDCKFKSVKMQNKCIGLDRKTVSRGQMRKK